jgi:hypothetical protein
MGFADLLSAFCCILKDSVSCDSFNRSNEQSRESKQGKRLPRTDLSAFPRSSILGAAPGAVLDVSPGGASDSEYLYLVASHLNTRRYSVASTFLPGSDSVSLDPPLARSTGNLPFSTILYFASLFGTTALRSSAIFIMSPVTCRSRSLSFSACFASSVGFPMFDSNGGIGKSLTARSPGSAAFRRLRAPSSFGMETKMHLGREE